MQNSRTLERFRSFTNVRFHLRAIALVIDSKALATRALVVLGIVSLVFLAGCGGGTSQSVNNQPPPPPPTPTINLLFPNCVSAGEQFVNSVNNQLTVSGTNFVASSVVRWNGADRPTTLEGGQLIAQISASDIAAPGTAAVTVFNPPPGGGSSSSLTFTITTGAVSPQSIAVDPAGKFAYVADTEIGASCDVGYVSMYMINPTTGALASIGLPVSTQDSNAESVTVDPFGKFAYVANYGSVTIYTINPTTGALASIGPPVSTGDSDANSVTVDPFGKFAYVASMGNPDFSIGGDGSVTMYTINATTGALTYTGSILGNCPGLCVPLSVVVDPSGKFAYVPNGAGIVPNVAMYTINATTGALTSIGTVAVAVGGFANWAAVDPSGKFAYVTASPTGSADDVSMYTINATTGALTSIGTVAAGTGPVSVVVDPSGKFAYVANRASNDISMYTINATTGALTSIGTIAAGSIPTSIAIHPSGKFAYVTNFGSNDVSMYNIDTTTGVLTLIGTIGT